MEDHVKKHLMNESSRVITGTSAKQIEGTDKVTGVETSEGTLSCEMVIMAA